ncbi:hypothetical protein HMPREF1548_04938 [Clostridium sp. KLE 1755]|nr:hypothetical protein HMPREF1548_04938 [Clostridium sp. KLE 1755]
MRVVPRIRLESVPECRLYAFRDFFIPASNEPSSHACMDI